MYMRVGLMDGEILQTVDETEERIMDQIAENGGYIGSGAWENVRVENIDDMIAAMTRMFDLILSADEATLTLNMPHGEQDILGEDVAWIRFVRD